MTTNQQASTQAMFAEYFALARIQDETNRQMAGPDWIRRALDPSKDLSDNRMPLSYTTAALIEAYELSIVAVNYKWWAKPGQLDRPAAVMELVDILHFAISGLLVSEHEIDEATGEVSQVYEGIPYDNVASVILTPWTELFQDDENDFDESSTPMIDPSNVGDSLILNEACRTLVQEIMMEDEDAFGNAFWISFWTVAHLLDSSPERIAALYRAKAVLNRFRNNNGARTGTYSKSWMIPADIIADGDAPYVTKSDSDLVYEYTGTLSKGETLNEANLTAYLTETYARHLDLKSPPAVL